MEEKKNDVLKTRPGTQFKKKGANKKGKSRNFSHEPSENAQIPNPSDTVYRILCPSRRIGSVIGKGGGRIKAIREETLAKVSISESVPGLEERVVMIFSPPDRKPKMESEEGNEEDVMVIHCPAQEALMKVHERIIEDDMIGRKEDGDDENDENDDENDFLLTIRLLVPHNMVGCLLGKGGDVIKKLRNETGASIRVLPYEHLPPCALSTDELVQIQGKPNVIKKALYEVSTLLHQNPRKEKALNFAMPVRGQAFHPSGSPIQGMPPPRSGNPMWSPHDPSPHMLPPPWRENFGSNRGFMPGGFDDGMGRPGVEPSGEFSMKILCSDSKIGGVIGKGGMNVRQLEQETGSNIHVEEASASSEDRVIRVSAFETLRNPRSQTIDALLVLQNKVGQVSEKGTITTRLLVPSSKVGCLLGQGGSIINEMRRRTLADIRLCKKEEKPKCASEEEELVQVSGSFAVAKDALGEIGSRLRARSLKDGSAGAEPAPPRPVQGYGAGGGFPRGPTPMPGPVGVGPPGGYHAVKDYEPPVHSGASGYPNPNSSVEARYPNSKISSIPGAGGGIYSNAPEAPGMRMKIQDPYHGGSEPKADIHGAPNQFNAPPNMPYNYHQAPYPNPNPNGQAAYQTMAQPHPPPYSDPSAQGSYHNMAPQQSYPDPSGQAAYHTAYAVPDPNANPNGQSAYQTQQVAYQGGYQNAHQVPYEQNSGQQSDPNSQHIAYQAATTQGAYQY